MVPVEALVLYIYFLNIVLMWKIVVPAEASVLYIYIDYWIVPNLEMTNSLARQKIAHFQWIFLVKNV